MLMQNFGVTNKQHFGLLWSFLEWSTAEGSQGFYRTKDDILTTFLHFPLSFFYFFSQFQLHLLFFNVIRTDCVIKNCFFCSFKESAIDTQLDNRHIMLRGDTVRLFMLPFNLILLCN